MQSIKNSSPESLICFMDEAYLRRSCFLYFCQNDSCQNVRFFHCQTVKISNCQSVRLSYLRFFFLITTRRMIAASAAAATIASGMIGLVSPVLTDNVFTTWIVIDF